MRIYAKLAGWRSLVLTWGTTPTERHRSLPCDELVSAPDVVLWRALDVDAPAPVVFRWLCQLRVAPYSYDWIDNRGRRSPRHVTPGVDRLARGQEFMSIFHLVDFEPDASVTLQLARAHRLFGDVALTYEIEARGERRSRLLVKIVVRAVGLGAAVQRRLLPVGDFFMMRKQLLTLKALAEEDPEVHSRTPRQQGRTSLLPPPRSQRLGSEPSATPAWPSWRRRAPA